VATIKRQTMAAYGCLLQVRARGFVGCTLVFVCDINSVLEIVSRRCAMQIHLLAYLLQHVPSACWPSMSTPTSYNTDLLNSQGKNEGEEVVGLTPLKKKGSQWKLVKKAGGGGSPPMWSRGKALVDGLAEAEAKCEIDVQYLTFPVENLRFNKYRSRAWTVYFANTQLKKYGRLNGEV